MAFKSFNHSTTMLDYIPIELINILGFAICIIALIYGITHQEPPFKERLNRDRAEAQKAQAYQKKKDYNRAHPLTESQKQTRLLRNLFWLTFFTRRK